MAPRPYVVGDSSPFLKRVLIPFWVIRILIMVIQIGVYALIVAGLGVFKDDVKRLADEYNSELNYDGLVAVSVIIMLIILGCLILDIVSIVKRSKRTLSPRFFLIINSIQTTFYLVNFILSMIGPRSPLVIVINIFIFLSFLGLLIYAVVVFHWFRKGKLSGGTYVQTLNPEVHNLVPGAVPTTAYPSQTTSPYPPAEYAAKVEQPYYYGQQQPAPQHVGVQAYEPYASHPVEYGQAPAGPAQQGYEMHPRP
ncbi:hypothetical protein VTJ83DRAFT_6034 [Remersonia thermophila]|uniref:Uncharacterized protein n=1 Tax=Remersonia thermophila TaxID=72144 RepID=A0ABR4D8T6_9PEZI